MPSKRTRSKERERKKILRAKITSEELRSKNEKRRKERANKSEEWKERERDKLRDRMKKLRLRRKLDKSKNDYNFVHPPFKLDIRITEKYCPATLYTYELGPFYPLIKK